MSATGFIQVHAYTSYAQIPLEDVAIVITDANGSAIAMRLTNQNGQLNKPIEISVPDLSASQNPNTGIIPYGAVDIYARIEDYELIHVERLQVFPDTTTEQNLEMIPLSEFPDSWNKQEILETTPQNL